MSITYEQLAELGKRYGESFYLLHGEQFAQNYRELTAAVRALYPKFCIAYSYKTNYIPRLCKLVDDLGGYAEVVSAMELAVALRAGVQPERILFNGPYKDESAVERLLLSGGTVNLDSLAELASIGRLADAHPDSVLRVGVRVNFDIGDGVLSRFGFDAAGDDLRQALRFCAERPSVRLVGLHCHFASRGLDTWPPRVRGMFALLDALGLRPEHIDLGGGLFGKMDDALKRQFDTPIPTYADYATVVGDAFAERYCGVPEEERPLLLLEPGSALAGDCMSLAAPVKSLKTVRGKAIATVLASKFNLNMGAKNPPLEVVRRPGSPAGDFADVDIAGYTCIESDYLYRGYRGPLAVGDYLLFHNAGSYSIVFKPPFILPNFAVLELGEEGAVTLIKRAETADDLFQTYSF